MILKRKANDTKECKVLNDVHNGPVHAVYTRIMHGELCIRLIYNSCYVSSFVNVQLYPASLTASPVRTAVV